MLSQINTTAIVLTAGAFLLAVFFAYVHRQKRQDYLLVWALAWLLASLHFARYVVTSSSAFPARYDLAFEWLMAAAALAFYSSSRLYAGLKLSTRAVLAVAGVAAVWSYVYSREWIPLPLGAGVAIAFFGAAQLFWQEGRKQESRADKLVGGDLRHYGSSAPDLPVRAAHRNALGRLICCPSLCSPKFLAAC